jgi:3-oxoacyl-[acyl-carrier protein] reductase
MASLTGKVAIVTGASQGIGQAIALRLGSEGAMVVVNYAGNADKAQEVVTKIEELGGQAIAIKADVSNALDVRQLFEQTLQKFGQLDFLINNAGWKPEDAPLAETAESDFERAFAVNVRGTFLCSREAVKHLQQQGRIINFASIVVTLAAPNQATYAATKAAVEAITRAHAKELAGKQITVNAIAPGATDTAMMRQGKTQEEIQGIIDTTPLKRLGHPEDIANTVVFLLTDQGGWINGQIIHCNGGIV